MLSNMMHFPSGEISQVRGRGFISEQKVNVYHLMQIMYFSHSEPRPNALRQIYFWKLGHVLWSVKPIVSKSKYPLSLTYNHSLSLNQQLWRHEGESLSVQITLAGKATNFCAPFISRKTCSLTIYFTEFFFSSQEKRQKLRTECSIFTSSELCFYRSHKVRTEMVVKMLNPSAPVPLGQILFHVIGV